MIPKPITIEGKSGTVMYLDALWHPTTPEHATMAKVLFDDGSVSFYTAQQETVEKYDPQQLRDEKGRWAKGAGNLGTTYLHGTAQGFLEDILRNGIRGSEGGKIHPKDKQKRKLALPGHVYMTTDLEEAKEYAQSAGVSDEFFLKNKETVLNPVYAKGYPRVPEYEPSYDAGTEIGGGLPCVITIELPPSVVKKLRKDRRSDILTPDPYAPGGGKRVLSDVARSYKGDIKPEWIKSITYMTRDMATGKEEWHTIDAKDYKKPGPQTPPYLPQPPGWEVSPEWQAYLKDKKVAAEGTVFYIPLRIPLQSIAGLGGITRKFDEVKHPRGEDGRFIEATQPRIFNRPSEIVKDVSWGETSWRWIDKETGKPSGRILTGEPIPRDQIPAKLYHVTTNAPAVESSGVLLGLLESGGLGGGQAEGVSFTSSKEDAVVIQRELRRAVQIARGDVDFDVFDEWARNDELVAGLPEGALAPAVKYMRDFVEGNIHSINATHVSDPTGEYADENRGKTYGWIGPIAPEERERKRRSLMKDALNAYLQMRESTAEKITGQRVPILKNPILFGHQEQLAKLKVENIQILEAAVEDIPAEALVTTGSDKFLHEVRVYADVPRRRKKLAYDPNQARGAEGTPEGGQFVETGRSGVATPDPVLAAQAATGIATIEKLLPQAMKMVDEGHVIRKQWSTADITTKQATFQAFAKKYAALTAEKGIEETQRFFDMLPEYAKTERMHEYLKEAGLSQIVEYAEPSTWVTGVERGDRSQAGYEASAVLARRLTILRTDELRKERGLLGPGEWEKFTIHDDENEPWQLHGTTARFAVRDVHGQVVADANTLEEAQAAGERWAIATAQESIIKSERLIQDVWDAWKHQSSDGLGLSLQLAASLELGGYHRMTADEVQEALDYAVQELGNDGMATLQAYVRAQWEVTQFVMHKAGENTVSVYRGLMLPGDEVKAATQVVVDKMGGPPKAAPTNIKLLEQRASPELDTPEKPPLKVFVTFDYDGEHFVVEKTRLPAKSIYDLAPGESPIRYEDNEVAVQRRVTQYLQSRARQDLLFTKLPDLKLLRAGAQSTTGSRAVANDWGGVGELPPDPERVVVRIEAPATSVLSLPIYGANTQAEHETVVVGTRDKWLWDAWYDRAPAFESQTISGAPVQKKPLVMEWSNPLGYDDEMALKGDKTLVIDLQAEDRGKPHWMSSVDWQSIAQKFDETKHPRHPEGSTEGGRFAESGTSGVATPDPRLVEQAKAGILSVEKLIPEAIQTADYSESLPDVWDDLTPKVQDKVHDKWQSDSYDDVNPDTSSVDNQYWDNLREENQEVLDEAVEETLTVLKEKFPDLDPALVVEGGDGFSLKRTLDPDSLDYGAGDDEDNRVELDWAALRFSNGQPLTEEEQHIVKGVWDTQYGLAFQEAFDKRLDDEQYNDDVRSLEQDILDEQWNEMSDRDKMELLERYDIKAILDPKAKFNWVTGVTEGEHGEESYNRTHAVALRLTELRFEELRKERKLLEPKPKPHYEVVERTDEELAALSVYDGKARFIVKDAEGKIVVAENTRLMAEQGAETWAHQQMHSHMPSKEIISTVWQEWKQSSSDGLSLSLQLAAARELGGHHRLTPDEVIEGIATARRYGGLETLQAYVRAQWEVTQTVMANAKQDKIAVYRGLMLPGETVDHTPKVYVRRATGEVVAPTNIVVSSNPRLSYEITQAAEDHFLIKDTAGLVIGASNTKEQATINAEKWLKSQSPEVITFDFDGKDFTTQQQDMQDKIVSAEGVEEYVTRRETVDEAIARHLSAYEPYIRQHGLEVKLPMLPLKRAGAQSTTGTASVANNWNGVGDLPPDPTRVVLRIEAPSTSVLSLPVYGQNEQAEHETVVLGTPDRWLWDAWQTEAPEYHIIPISATTARKMDKPKQKLLEIDLQALDRGKPHWLTGVNWQTVVKWDERKHPRDKDGQFTEGVGAQATQFDTGAGGRGGVAVPSSTSQAGRPRAAGAAQAVADDYNAKHGLPPVQHDYVKLDEGRAGTIADAYDALPLDDSGNPEVRAAYQALAMEIRAQFDHIVASGVTFTPWTKEGQPYQTSTEMVEDIRQNKHMFFYTGGEPNEFMAARDPETGLTVNDMFRAVHDYFGHAAGGYGFGPRGEENAWMSHSQMLSPLARRALTTETRGQNSWVNFGRHNYDAEGNHKNIPPKDRPFATQKTALMPEHYALLPGETSLKWDESKHQRDEKGRFAEGQFTRVALTSQRPEGDPEHKPNKEVFRHMREFHEQLAALPGVSRVSVKPGVGGWDGGSESMWQIYYKGNGEARKLVARTAKAFHQDAVLILNKCEGHDCQPAVELSFEGAISPSNREYIHQTMVDNGISGWTWMKRDGKSVLRMVRVPQWEKSGAPPFQPATAAISQELREGGLKNHRKVHKVAVSVMEQEGENSYDSIITES